MVFQNPDNQIVATITEEDVAFGPENLGLPREEIRKRVDDALKTVGMYEYRDHAPHLLSGGQKQRIAIAGIIAMRPRCIVLDEPTSMLDPSGRRDVLRITRELNKNHGITIVLITHHMNEAAMADRIIIMDRGKMVLEGTPKEIFPQTELLHKLGLSVPQTVELLSELNRAGFDFPLDKLSPTTIFSFPQSQRHLHKCFPLWSFPEYSKTKSRPYLSPVLSLNFAITQHLRILDYSTNLYYCQVYGCVLFRIQH